MAARKETITRQLLTHVEERIELSDGYRLLVSASWAWREHLFAFIEAERACCPFFTFDLSFAAENRGVWRAIRGPEGAKVFLLMELGFAQIPE